MTEQSHSFLEEELSGFRGEYLGQIEANLSNLLEAFDSVALHGFSAEKDQRYKQSNPFDLVAYYGKQDRPVYQRLSAQLAPLDGEKREEFLYELRRAIGKARELVTEADAEMEEYMADTENLVKHKDIVPLVIVDLSLLTSHFQLEELRGVSSAYKDIYRAMVDAVKQGLQQTAQPQ